MWLSYTFARMNELEKHWRSGREAAPAYYARHAAAMLVPSGVVRQRASRLVSGWERRADAAHIRGRVDFYCRREGEFALGDDAVKARDIRLGRYHSRYVFDIVPLLKAFDPEVRVLFHQGDVWSNPVMPTLTKARRLDALADNGVLLKLNSYRHYLTPRDHISFWAKRPVVIFRGQIDGKPEREALMRCWADSPLCDFGDTTTVRLSQWHCAPISVAEHFSSRYVLAPEGNDVASCLQWVMASQCVPVMHRPTVESWLMHSLLVPERHYIEVEPDFSDLGEKIAWYNAHPAEAELISRESQRWAAQFADSRREYLIGLLVVDKYMRLSGQQPLLQD